MQDETEVQFKYDFKRTHLKIVRVTSYNIEKMSYVLLGATQSKLDFTIRKQHMYFFYTPRGTSLNVNVNLFFICIVAHTTNKRT